MLVKTREVNPWIQTVEVLRRVSATGRSKFAEPGNRRRNLVGPVWRWGIEHQQNYAIRITERCTPRTVTVEWCDSTAGRYGAQTWGYSIARKEGVCLLSGATISRGEAIYRPRTSRRVPANQDAMILATQTETVVSDGL